MRGPREREACSWTCGQPPGRGRHGVASAPRPVRDRRSRGAKSERGSTRLNAWPTRTRGVLVDLWTAARTRPAWRSLGAETGPRSWISRSEERARIHTLECVAHENARRARGLVDSRPDEAGMA